MEETHAVIAILLIAALTVTGYFVINGDTTGAITQNYVSCCCSVLARDELGQGFHRASQVQIVAPDCKSACQLYQKDGHSVFAHDGLCTIDNI